MKHNFLVAIGLGMILVAGSGAFAKSMKSIRTQVDLMDPNFIPEPADFPAVEAGQSQRLKRSHENAPPQIPHSIEGMEISLAKNECANCHLKTEKTKPGVPVMKESHFIGQSGKKLTSYYKGRYFCVTCHVPQANAPAVVKNTNY